ncbi:MAG: hypothetical protein JKP90_16490 [Desulfofustis sp. PB-SRB1]|nr:hypothetical protein [Desulfofustis sp. PB-SRB1]
MGDVNIWIPWDLGCGYFVVIIQSNSTTKPETASILITANIVDDTRLEWLTLVCQMFNFAVKIEQFM